MEKVTMAAGRGMMTAIGVWRLVWSGARSGASREGGGMTNVTTAVGVRARTRSREMMTAVGVDHGMMTAVGVDHGFGPVIGPVRYDGRWRQ